MALANHKPNAPTRVRPDISAVTGQTEKHETYDHNTTPLWSLDSFIQGSKWTVTWFHQRLGKNDPPKKLDVSTDRSAQAYDRVIKLDLLVQTPLSSNFDSKKQEMSVSGSAIFISTMVPTVDDYIVAASNLHRLGLFRITNVNRSIHERESVYTVEYVLEEEVTEESRTLINLEYKVVNRYVFSRQRLIENREAIILEESHVRLQDFQGEFRRLANAYFRDFVSYQTRTLALPGQNHLIVDPYVQEFVLSIVPMEMVPEVARIHSISTNNNPDYKRPTIWDILLRRDYEELPYAERVMGLQDPRQIRSPFFGRSGTFVAANYIVRPIIQDESLKSVDSASCVRLCEYETKMIEMGPDNKPSPVSAIFQHGGDYDGLGYLPAFNPVVFGETYIFSKNFYDHQPSSILEVALRDYLMDAAINPIHISKLLKAYRTMGRLDQFYYGPMIMVLILEAVRRNYT